MKANERRNQIGYKQKRKPVRIGKSSRAESTWFDSYANTSLESAMGVSQHTSRIKLWAGIKSD